MINSYGYHTFEVSLIPAIRKLFRRPVQDHPEIPIAHFDKVREKEKAFTTIDRGTSEVPLDRIVGSVGRYHDFDTKFTPKGYGSDERLRTLTREMSKGKTFPQSRCTR